MEQEFNSSLNKFPQDVLIQDKSLVVICLLYCCTKNKRTEPACHMQLLAKMYDKSGTKVIHQVIQHTQFVVIRPS